MSIQLGSKVRDSVTGFEGRVIARLEHLNGCVQYGVKAPWDGVAMKMPEGEWIDEGQLEVLDFGPSAGCGPKTKKSGGPMNAPTTPARGPRL